MYGFRFVHAADLHLDTPFAGLGRSAPWLREALQGASLTAFDRLVQLAVDESAAFMVWAGDVFDHTAPSLRAQLALRDGLETLRQHGILVFWAHGNHDPYEALSTHIKWPDNLHRFPPDQVTHVSVPKPGRRHGPLCEVYGISYPTESVTESYAARFRRSDRASWAMAVLHGNVGGQPGHDNYAPAALGDLTANAFDYWALGHVHHRQVLSENPWVVYPGNLQGRHPRETDPKGAYVGAVDESGHTTLEFHSLAPVTWQFVTCDVSGLALVDEVEDALISQLADLRPTAGEQGMLVRVQLTGRSRELARVPPDDWGALAERLSSGGPGSGTFTWVEAIQSHVRPPLAADPTEGLLAQALHELNDVALPSQWARLWPFAQPADPAELDAVRERVRDRLRNLLGEELDDGGQPDVD